jgi:hypothetical protein
MAKTVKVPSLQHMARNWRDTPDGVRRKLVTLAKRPPQFSYDPLFAGVRDMLVFGIPYAQVVEGIRRAERRPWVRELLIEVLPLISNHFTGIEPDGPPRRVVRRHYPLARDILIPFEAPLEYSVGGQVYFPWFSFWRRNPLAARQLSLFVTIVDEVLLQDPDLDRALFQILDFSIREGERKRRLLVVDAKEIPRLNEREKHSMLEVFTDGFRLARAELAGVRSDRETRDRAEPDFRQKDLFNPDPDQ